MIPKNCSPGEECFSLQCRAYKLNPQREYRFMEGRKYAFDFAFVDAMVAVEVEGGAWSGGRHTRGKGFEADCEKYNLATSLGWRVFRFTTEMVMRGDAINLLLTTIFEGDL
jgi:very-short-patch-repair endonuclease